MIEHSRLNEISEKLQALERELAEELEKQLREKQEQFRYTVKKGKVLFDRSISALHKHNRIGIWAYIKGARIAHILSAPVIYSLFFPFLLVDLSVTIYQQICFRIYRIPLVKRDDFVLIDRHHLAYLNPIEKFNCVYCGYVNGVIEYVREVAGRTEQYWCPIKHAARTPDPHRFSQRFSDYGDAEAYRRRIQKLRDELLVLGGRNA